MLLCQTPETGVTLRVGGTPHDTERRCYTESLEIRGSPGKRKGMGARPLWPQSDLDSGSLEGHKATENKRGMGLRSLRTSRQLDTRSLETVASM